MAKRNRKYDEVSYWETFADGMVALLLMILLIMMLLILYLVRIPDEDFVDLFRGDQYEEYQDADAGGGNHNASTIDEDAGDQWHEEDHENGVGGSPGGGSEGGSDGSGEDDYEDPDPGAGEGTGLDRAAVFVQVVDGETGRTIKLKGIEFELYGQNSALQVLNTYYPLKIEYKKFETDASGVFYLPEKVPLTEYYLHQLTGLPGYDTTENVHFTVDRPYDWPEPYVVTVSLYPAKNVIEIQTLDKNNGESVSGASFDVIAAEDIVTKDGTTRFKQGDVVDNIEVNRSGSGVSRELFLGKYTLRQNKVPELYARTTQEYTTVIEERTEAERPPVVQIGLEKTALKVQLVDALYDTVYVAGAEFSIRDDDGNLVERVTTDAKGSFTMTNLKKNTTYHIQQETTVGAYLIDQADHAVTVSSDGIINGKAQGSLVLHNRMIRVSIGVRDRVFRGQVSDVNVALRDSNNNVVKNWNTTGMEQVVEGLTPGEYTVVIAGDTHNANTIQVQDLTELQRFDFDQITTADIGAAFGLIVVVVGTAVIIRLVVRRNKHHKTEGGET